MPIFDLVALSEAPVKAATGKRAQLVREYVEYIAQVKEGQAGRLQAAEGESVAAVRRRLGNAAKLAGKELVIRRTGEELYFWAQEKGAPRRRRRRSRPEVGADA